MGAAKTFQDLVYIAKKSPEFPNFDSLGNSLFTLPYDNFFGSKECFWKFLLANGANPFLCDKNNNNSFEEIMKDSSCDDWNDIWESDILFKLVVLHYMRLNYIEDITNTPDIIKKGINDLDEKYYKWKDSYKSKSEKRDKILLSNYEFVHILDDE